MVEDKTKALARGTMQFKLQNMTILKGLIAMKYFDSRIFLSCILFTSSNLEAKTLDHLNLLCSGKIENVLQKWNVKPEFRSTLRTETVEVFESPTPELGTWVRIQKKQR